MLVFPVAVASLVSLVAVQGHSVDEDSFFTVSYSVSVKAQKKDPLDAIRDVSDRQFNPDMPEKDSDKYDCHLGWGESKKCRLFDKKSMPLPCNTPTPTPACVASSSKAPMIRTTTGCAKPVVTTGCAKPVVTTRCAKPSSSKAPVIKTTTGCAMPSPVKKCALPKSNKNCLLHTKAATSKCAPPKTTPACPLPSTSKKPVIRSTTSACHLPSPSPSTTPGCGLSTPTPTAVPSDIPYTRTVSVSPVTSAAGVIIIPASSAPARTGAPIISAGEKVVAPAGVSMASIMALGWAVALLL